MPALQSWKLGFQIGNGDLICCLLSCPHVEDEGGVLGSERELV